MKTVLNKILVEPSGKSVVENEIGLISSSDKDSVFKEGTVLSVGNLVENVKEGDTVIYDKHRSHNIIIDGKDVIVMEINCIFVVK